MRRQSEQIRMMSDREVLIHLYVTQLLLIVMSVIAGFFLFDLAAFRKIWHFDAATVLMFGGGSAVIVLSIDFLSMRYLPEHWYDDGGINEKIFENRSIPHIFFLCLLIAFSEELLFRGVIQTHFGLFVASTVFALLHVRYLEKLFLFAMVVLLSFFLGYIYELTNSLWVTIFAHFLIDFVLAVDIRLNYIRNMKQKDGGDRV
ncbi:CPBP family intramembrane glutamic endopeptidase [Parageobacillus thermoglucosidasius]|uniref:CPBP family intramembrane glutamic endopeptidase n=1 Tax=Parageobacillus thermoglucosidasius TaxID=1426 RepID=UPI000E38A0F6|nr:CPBP family intramembrane glutamic endopeptidase [Parageobacillus thermoglucosidasius]REK58652.1 MAG: CPBP family intramembrane metalloprotease [Geobacillus sp.]MED4906052.1 CPBP family intramembrane metalloprotease [Parageobacillus thermoglucosidasius]MED4914475.1 CPBP family intramembrane metalloprotease [Parageobacillus thermoglucosidasius]MED4946902.1 CPBP family intramembrane metalloprotease [Parageobacillus thermoglucosidasius]MED4983056.1 CPBP family intramembrane metalloprotease [Pa